MLGVTLEGVAGVVLLAAPFLCLRCFFAFGVVVFWVAGAVEAAGLGAVCAIAVPSVNAPPAIKAVRIFMLATFPGFISE